MTKVELIAAVANDANLTKKDAEAAVNSALNAITAALKDGDKVTLVGFGTFEVRERPERKGRNPQTGEETPMTMELSPWGVSFSWKPSDPMPRVFGYVVPVSDKDILNGSCSGYVRTPDGLTRQIEKSEEELSNLFYHVGHVPYVYVDQAYAEGRVTLYMSFLEPVDPSQVQEVYAEDGTLMWKK